MSWSCDAQLLDLVEAIASRLLEGRVGVLVCHDLCYLPLDLYPYESVVERLQRPKPLDYQMWTHMRAVAVYTSTGLRFGLPRLMAPTLRPREDIDASAAKEEVAPTAKTGRLNDV